MIDDIRWVYDRNHTSVVFARLRMNCWICGQTHDVELREATVQWGKDAPVWKAYFLLCPDREYENTFFKGDMDGWNTINMIEAYEKAGLSWRDINVLGW